jgi:uncharacterized membrane protein
MKLAHIRKALVAAVTAAGAAAATAYPNGFTDVEISAIASAAIIAGLAVFQIRNEPQDGAQ